MAEPSEAAAIALVQLEGGQILRWARRQGVSNREQDQVALRLQWNCLETEPIESMLSPCGNWEQSVGYEVYRDLRQDKSHEAESSMSWTWMSA